MTAEEEDCHSKCDKSERICDTEETDENSNTCTVPHEVINNNEPTSDDKDDNVPEWLFCHEYQHDNMVPVNTLKMTDETTVRRVYQMARVMDKTLTQGGVRYYSWHYRDDRDITSHFV